MLAPVHEIRPDSEEGIETVRLYAAAARGCAMTRTFGPRPSYDEVRELGSNGSYPALAAYIRRHGRAAALRAMRGQRTRERSIITHDPGRLGSTVREPDPWLTDRDRTQT